MKTIILFYLVLFSYETFAVCATPISRTNIGFGVVLTSTKYNSDFNTIFNRVNNLPGDCIEDGTVTSAKLASGSITTVKIADGAITTAKLATGAIPEVGRLIRISSFTSSGTWTLQSDVGAIFVQLVGGGGASYDAGATDGGNTSFGGHCIGNGGKKSLTSGDFKVGGLGGTATNGDINIQGAQGATSNESGFSGGGAGAPSMFGHFGSGGTNNASPKAGGGGAGGYCAKYIRRANLNATETVTIGAGGTSTSGFSTMGNPGIVIVYEYSL